MTDTIPFSRPAIGEAEIAAGGERLRSGWITSGPRTAQCEREFAAAHGVTQALAVAATAQMTGRYERRAAFTGR